MPESSAAEQQEYTHETLAWLKPDNIRDVKKRSPDHPDYDETTLHVPPDFLNKQTPAMQQWWRIKSQNYNVVLFFKVMVVAL